MSQSKTNQTILALGFQDGKPFIERIPHITGEGKITRISKRGNKTLWVVGNDAGFPGLFVKTTEKTLRPLLQCNPKDARQIFGNVWKALKGVKIDEVYEKGGKEWDDFSTDVVIFLCCRQVLFGTPIPICANPPTQ